MRMLLLPGDASRNVALTKVPYLFSTRFTAIAPSLLQMSLHVAAQSVADSHNQCHPERRLNAVCVLGQRHTGNHRKEAWTAVRAQFPTHLCELCLPPLHDVSAKHMSVLRSLCSIT